MKSKAIFRFMAIVSMGGALTMPAINVNSNLHSRNEILFIRNNNVKINHNIGEAIVNNNNRVTLFKSTKENKEIEKLSTGEVLWIIKEEKNYYKVKVEESGNTGYILKSNVLKISNCENDKFTSLKGKATIVNVSSVVNLRKSAGINSLIINKLKDKTTVTLLGKKGRWYKVYVSGQTGYVYNEYISLCLNNKENTNKNINENVNKNVDNSYKMAYINNTNKNKSPIFVTESYKNKKIRWELDSGDKVKLIGKRGDLYKIQYGSAMAYINKKYLTLKNNGNEIHQNDNKEVSKYFGEWTVGKTVGNAMSENYNMPSYEGKKLILTKGLFSFDGTVIKNPNYYIISMNPNTYFGYLKNNNINGLTLDKYGQVKIILPVSSSKKITNIEFIDSEPLIGMNSRAILISGSGLVTFGGGKENSSINQCIKDN